MKNKKYQIFSSTLLAFSIILLIFFLLSIAFIYINHPSLILQLNSEGFSNFLKIYSPSLQIGTFAIVFFTLWLTLERMKQTEHQLYINQENVKFNNYYKHKEEFSSFLNKMDFLIFIKEHSKIGIETLIPAIYSYFFNLSYKNFEPTLNQNAKDEINDFIKEITNSSISIKNKNLEDVPIEEIQKIAELINRTIQPVVEINSQIEVAAVRQNVIGGQPIELIEERFRLLNNLFWTITLYENLLTFDGIYQTERASFTLNFNNYRATLGLEKTA